MAEPFLGTILGGKIQADYDELSKIANRFTLESMANDDLLQRVKRLVSSLEGGGWVGRGADAFYDEMHNEVMPAVKRLVQALEEASSTVKRISNLISQAETEASSSFNILR